MGSRGFLGQNGLFRRLWGNFGIFGVFGGSWLKIQGPLRNLGIFTDFLKFFSVWSGSGSNCK
jgi:hypothetical protein